MAHRGTLPQVFSFLKGKQESKQVSGETRQFGFGCHCFQEWSGETGCPVSIGSCIRFSQVEEPSFPWKARSSGVTSSLENPSCLTAVHSQAAQELLSGIPAQRHVLHTLGNTSLYQFISISLCITLKQLRSSSIGI